MFLNINSDVLLKGLLDNMPISEENAAQPADFWNRRISYARRANAGVSGITTIRSWVALCSSETIKPTLERVRAIPDKPKRDEAKGELPMAFPSAVLSTRDKNTPLQDKLLSYPGLICLDLDFHDGAAALAGLDDLKTIPYILFAGLSASGLGVFAFAATDNTDYQKHKIYWRALSDDLAERTGYENDEQTKDVTRGRFLSYTPEPFINDAVIPFTLPEGYEEQEIPTTPPGEDIPVNDDTLANVEDCVRQWEEMGCVLGDSTRFYRYGLGTALKVLGEEGFGYYERLCKGYQHPRTPRQEFDGFPANQAAYNGEKITLGTFFWIMRERYGIRPTEKEVRLPMDEGNELIPAIVKEVARVFQCPEEFAIVAMYAAASAVAGKKFSLWDGKRYNYAQIWAAIVAPSGTGKSEVLKWFFKPVDAIETEDYKVYRDALQEWKKGKEEGPKPKLRRRTAVDTTPEVRDQILAENPNGLCLVVDELKGLFDDLNRYNKSGEVGRLLSNYSNTSYYVDRKTQEPLRIENPVLSIIGTIQPSIFPQAYGGVQFAGNGFLPRWCFVWNDSHPKRTYSDLSVSPAISQKWGEIVRYIEEVGGDIVFQLSDDAKGLYESYYNELEDKIHRAKDDARKEMFAKVQINVLRWALVTAILAGEYDTDRAEISGESMQYAVNCFRYFERTGLRAIDAVNGHSLKLTKKDLIAGLKTAFPGLIQSHLAKSLGVTEAYISKVLKKK